jgi:hypothetical protein
MNSRRAELLIDLAWIVFAGSYCAVAAGYPPGGRMVPLTIGLIALALGVVHLSGNFIAMLRPLTHGVPDEATESHPAFERSEIVAALWATGLLVGIFLIGAVAAIFLFFLFYFGLRGKRWLLGLGSAIVMTAIAWGLFGQIIGVPLPDGIITHWLAF